MGVVKPNFSVGTHTFSSNISQPNDGDPRTYFEDRTDNHNKTMVAVRHLPATVLVDSVLVTPDSEMTVIITTRNGVLPPEPVPLNRFISFQVEDVIRVDIVCTEPTNQFSCVGEITIQKTFCIFC